MKLTVRDLHKVELDYTPKVIEQTALGDFRIIKIVEELRKLRKLTRKKYVRKPRTNKRTNKK